MTKQRMLSKRSGFVAAVACLVVACSPGGGSSAQSGAVSAVELTPQSATMGVGSVQALTATAKSADGDPVTDVVLTWASSDPGVASVNSDGVVTAVAVGRAVISAGADDKLGLAVIAVSTPVGAVSTTPSEVSVVRGKTYPLGAITRDGDGNPLGERIVTWSSSDPAIATVTSTGLVAGVSVGSATVTATSEGKTATTLVSVTGDDVATAAYVDDVTSCGITVSGALYCWGGELWDGAGVTTTLPVEVDLGQSVSRVVSTANATMALTTDGTAFAWGLNIYGILGNGTGAGDAAGTYQTTPAPVVGGLKFKTIGIGGLLACGITIGGDAYCWGGGVDVPTLVPGGLKFDSITVGYNNVLALTSDGTAYGWGSNTSGELGDGTNTGRSSPVPVSGGLKFKQISNRYDHTCAVTLDGAAYCWGANGNGQLGTGDNTLHLSPVPVTGGHTFTRISTGALDYTVALALDGTAYVWGIELGYPSGSAPTNLSPVAVHGTQKFVTLEAGRELATGLSPEGEALGWGTYPLGLGDGSVTASTEILEASKPSYTLTVPSTLNIEAGHTVTFAVTLTPLTGGFTAYGPKPFTSDVTITLTAPETFSVSVDRSTLSPANPIAVVTVTVPAETAPGSFGFKVEGQSPGISNVQSNWLSLTVPQPPPTGGTLALSCPTGEHVLTSGYQCLSTGDADPLFVPGQFAGRAEIDAMHGTWVDEEVGLCIEWGSDGQARGHYKGDDFGNPAHTTDWGEWGVIVRSNGEPEQTTSGWYVYTEKLDAQTKLLGFDPKAQAIVGWQFVKTSCPW